MIESKHIVSIDPKTNLNVIQGRVNSLLNDNPPFDIKKDFYHHNGIVQLTDTFDDLVEARRAESELYRYLTDGIGLAPSAKVMMGSEKDYHVEFTYPSGATFSILVPKNQLMVVAPSDSDKPYGLNLVTNGHYE